MNKLKILFTIVIITISSLSSNGQINKIYIGIYGGPDVGSLHGDIYYASHHDLRTGYAAGLFVQYNLTKTYSLQTGVNYETKGSKWDLPLLDDKNILLQTLHGQDNFNFIVFPLLFKASSNNRISVSVFAGGYYGILLKETRTSTGAITYYDGTNNFKKSESGISAGFGFSYPLKQKMILSIDLKNNFGLNDLNNAKTFVGLTTKTYSADFLFGIAYRLW